MTKSATREAADEVSAPIASPSFTGNVVTQGVNPTITIQDSDEAGDGFIKFKTANGTQRGYIQTAMTSDVMIFGTGTTERMRLISSGGLTFNGDTAAANALDDYEEGTWTPAYTGSSTSGQTYSAQEGSYTKIGRVVHIQAWVKVTNKGTMSGPIRISGFPFTVSPTNQSAISIGYTNGYNLTAGNNLQLWAYSDSFVYLFQAGGTNNSAHITTGDLDTEVWTAIGGTYHTNA